MPNFTVKLPDGTLQSFDANVTAVAKQGPSPVPPPVPPTRPPGPVPNPGSAISDVIIDLSHYDKVTPDWEQVYTSGIHAVILKATELDQTNGSQFVDSTFVSRAKAASAAGLLVGAYCFFTGASVDQQIGLFLQTALPLTTFLVLDYEDYPKSQPTLSGIKAAISLVKTKTARSPVIYCPRYMDKTGDPVLGSCPLWLPEWGNKPVPGPAWSRWNLWQYTNLPGSMPVPGIGQCQRSKFNGTTDQLHFWWGNPQP